jgi:Conjugative transposon protein TcpC
MTSPSSHPAVVVHARPMWRIRLSRELPAYLLRGLALAGLLASLRFAIDPPRPTIARATTPSSALVDRGAEGFASLFARRYLSWNSQDPEARRLALAPFVGSSMEAEAGLQPPESGEQQVLWTEIVQARVAAPSEHVYTVAAQTDTAGLLYLTVTVAREAGGSLALAGYPALVGAPASAPATLPEHLREVEEPALATVVTRALRNYLDGSASELAADLSATARVSPPGIALALESVQSLDWSLAGRSVLAVVRARDQHGAQYTLAYELAVVSDAGRWEIAAIQTNPDS